MSLLSFAFVSIGWRRRTLDTLTSPEPAAETKKVAILVSLTLTLPHLLAAIDLDCLLNASRETDCPFVKRNLNGSRSVGPCFCLPASRTRGRLARYLILGRAQWKMLDFFFFSFFFCNVQKTIFQIYFLYYIFFLFIKKKKNCQTFFFVGSEGHCCVLCRMCG